MKISTSLICGIAVTVTATITGISSSSSIARVYKTPYTSHNHKHHRRADSTVDSLDNLRWPTGKDGLSTITYCYMNKVTRDRLQKNITAAWNVWTTAMGGPASPTTGHRLAMKEIEKNGQPLDCTIMYLNEPAIITWNPDVPRNTLRIMEDDENDRRASWSWVSGGYRKLPQINYLFHNAKWDASAAPQALGRIFGLPYEHRRPDRDNYIYFNCEALNNYGFVKTRLEQTGESVEALCNHTYVPLDPKNINNLHSDFFAKYSANAFEKGDYDYLSIMHSYSAISEGGNCTTTKSMEKCPLMRYTTNQTGAAAPMEYIDVNRKPSDGDIKALKLLYPWRGPTANNTS